jgi:HEPN domain-containing protein
MAAKQQGKPDPKLAFITAEAFLEVCKLLTAAKRDNRRILIQAMATNAAFVLEMYLKCLLLLEGERVPRTHDLYNLFHALSQSTQIELTDAHKQRAEKWSYQAISKNCYSWEGMHLLTLDTRTSRFHRGPIFGLITSLVVFASGLWSRALSGTRPCKRSLMPQKQDELSKPFEAPVTTAQSAVTVL